MFFCFHAFKKKGGNKNYALDPNFLGVEKNDSFIKEFILEIIRSDSAKQSTFKEKAYPEEIFYAQMKNILYWLINKKNINVFFYVKKLGNEG